MKRMKIPSMKRAKRDSPNFWDVHFATAGLDSSAIGAKSEIAPLRVEEYSWRVHLIA